MKLRSLTIAITFLVLGTGGKFAYDDYREHELQKKLEALPTGSSCNFCPPDKEEHLARMKKINTRQSASGVETNNDTEVLLNVD